MQKVAVDLISLPIEMNDTIADTKFRLVHIASQRVRQLSAGAPQEVFTRSIKDTTVALEEAVAGKFKVIIGEAANVAKEEFRKREERAKADAQLSAKEEEIRKELSAYLSESAEEEGAEEGAEESTEEPGLEGPGEDGMDEGSEETVESEE
jgi:DNA-directed RNA polymerase subunit K/omega